MKTEFGELKPLSEVPQALHFQWTLGEIAKLLKLTKKQLRVALKVIQSSQIQAAIFKKGKTFKKTFKFGFNEFTIRGNKKNRKISEPHPELQWVFWAVKDWLEKELSPHKNTYGFVQGKNCKQAVEALMLDKLPLFRNRHFFSMDISNAFPSVTDQKVKSAIMELGINEIIADFIAWLVTCEEKDLRYLPQGSSCSPIILNLVFRPMCEEFDRICRKHGIVDWVAYVDDFTFAATGISEKAKGELLNVPTKFGFKVKEEKIKDNKSKTIPHMLGLTIVDGKVHIRRERKKEYRRIFHEALQGKHSSQKVSGLANYIKCIYGELKDWPGWLRNPYVEYLNSKLNLHKEE